MGRTATSGGTTTGVRYGYSGAGDVGTATLDTSGAVLERVISLPGGVIVTKRTGGDVWSYPNIHGDVTATANGSGVKQGSNLTYDPYGTPLGGTPDNLNGSMDYAWLGQHQRPYETAPGVTPAIEMGARLYAPELGRFLEVDPIEGGSANDYDYVNADPAGSIDVSGQMPNNGCRVNGRACREGDVFVSKHCYTSRGSTRQVCTTTRTVYHAPKNSGWWGGPSIQTLVSGSFQIVYYAYTCHAGAQAGSLVGAATTAWLGYGAVGGAVVGGVSGCVGAIGFAKKTGMDPNPVQKP